MKPRRKRCRYDPRKKERLAGAYWRGHFDASNGNEKWPARFRGGSQRAMYQLGYRHGAAMRDMLFDLWLRSRALL
jgi:hypothetical protein